MLAWFFVGPGEASGEGNARVQAAGTRREAGVNHLLLSLLSLSSLSLLLAVVVVLVRRGSGSSSSNTQ